MDFLGGTLTVVGGVVLLGLTDERLNLIPRLASCFEDLRSPVSTVHPVEALDGEQEELFFHGYYREYCDTSLLVFCGRTPLLARLRSAAVDGAAGVDKDLARLVERFRSFWWCTQTSWLHAGAE